MPDSVAKEPPRFNTDRSYERFETEIDAWSTITTVAPAKQGTLLMLSLPDNDRKFGDLRGKVMDGCDYKGVGGLKNVKDFLKLHIGQDDITDVVDKINTFMRTKRKGDQTVREYVSNFESSYNIAKAKAALPELPPLFLMWALTENASISEHDRKLVLSGIDLDKPEDIYKDSKKALLKYCGNDSSPCSAEASGGPLLAPESTFFSGRGRGWNNFRGKGKSRPRGDDHNFDPDRYHPKLNRDGLQLDGKQVNAKKDGKVMTCDFCGSFLHLWKDCRDRQEQRNSKKFRTYANMVDEDDE